MYLVALAWLYVVVMWAVVEATGPRGSLLGAFFTLLLYGVLPLSIVLYLGGTGARRRARRRAEAMSAVGNPDRSGEASGDAVAAEGKEA
jgi:hypothetical protein